MQSTVAPIFIDESMCSADGSTDVFSRSPNAKVDSLGFSVSTDFQSILKSVRESIYNITYEIGLFKPSAAYVDKDFSYSHVYPLVSKDTIHTTLELQRKLSQDYSMSEVYTSFTAEAERILQTQKKNCKIAGYVWKDQEIEDWEENVIEIKTEFQDFEEKEDLWDVLGSTLEKIQQDWVKIYNIEIGEGKRPFILHLSRIT